MISEQEGIQHIFFYYLLEGRENRCKSDGGGCAACMTDMLNSVKCYIDSQVQTCTLRYLQPQRTIGKAAKCSSQHHFMSRSHTPILLWPCVTV